MPEIMVRRTVNPDGSKEPDHKRPCPSPIHFRNIVADETMHYYGQPAMRFVLDRVPLSRVGEHLLERGF